MIFELNDIRHIAWVSRTGSREICDPPPMDTDDDYLIEIDPTEISLKKFLHLLNISEWSLPEKDGYGIGGDFTSLRKGNVNLIVTDDHLFGDKWRRATKIAKAANLLDKQDRINYFEAIVYNRGPLKDWDWDYIEAHPGEEENSFLVSDSPE